MTKDRKSERKYFPINFKMDSNKEVDNRERCEENNKKTGKNILSKLMSSTSVAMTIYEDQMNSMRHYSSNTNRDETKRKESFSYDFSKEKGANEKGEKEKKIEDEQHNEKSCNEKLSHWDSLHIINEGTFYYKEEGVMHTSKSFNSNEDKNFFWKQAKDSCYPGQCSEKCCDEEFKHGDSLLVNEQFYCKEKEVILLSESNEETNFLLKEEIEEPEKDSLYPCPAFDVSLREKGDDEEKEKEQKPEENHGDRKELEDFYLNNGDKSNVSLQVESARPKEVNDDDDRSNFVPKEDTKPLPEDSHDTGLSSHKSSDSQLSSGVEWNNILPDDLMCLSAEGPSFSPDCGDSIPADVSSHIVQSNFYPVSNRLSEAVDNPNLRQNDPLNINYFSMEIDFTNSFNNCEEHIIANNMTKNDFAPEKINEKSFKSIENQDTRISINGSCAPPSPKDLIKQPEISDQHQRSEPSQQVTLKSSKPRKRSGSENKRKSNQHRSKTQQKNNKRGHRSNSKRNSRENSLDSGGGSGDGDEDDDDEGKDRKNRRAESSPDKEDEEENDDDDEENTKSGEDKTEGVDSNLLSSSPVEFKFVGKDLTLLLGNDNSHKPVSVYRWRLDADHSCIPTEDFCDIIGAASRKAYNLPDRDFLPLNPCMTTLIHNILQANEGDDSVKDCQPCVILSMMLKHVARCESNAEAECASNVCDMCMQVHNLILHHTQICIQSGRPQTPYSRTDLCFKLCQNVRWEVQNLILNKADNILTIKKYCNKILTLPYDQEVNKSETASSDCQNVKDAGPSVKPKSKEQASGASENQRTAGLGQNGFRRSGLVRKPSVNSQRFIPPSISELEEEEIADESEKTSENSAMNILRRNYGPGGAGAGDGAGAATEVDTFDPMVGFSRDYLLSMPQGQINDQLQFNSFWNQPTGEKGVGEVVYNTVQQLNRIAGFWEEKKDQLKKTGKRPFQRAEEGVILVKYKDKFKILRTRYQLDCQWHKLTLLGNGMTGRCYLAMDKTTEFRFCVKKINLVDYKKEELCLWSDLDHPNVVTLYGALRHSDTIYLFTEYIDGGDLLHCINEHKSGGERLSHWLALNYFQQLLKLLVYLESKNLLHEDIKADNLLLRAKSFDIVLTDFGLCMRLQRKVELKNKQPVGTATHFSPEKAASQGHGFPACVWACVCVLVHMLSGQQPWNKYLKKVDYLNFTIFMKPPPLDDVPDNIRAIVKDLIAQGFTKDPEQRPNARQLLQHEAFNILNQETETLFSTLGSSHQSVGASRNARDKGPLVKGAVKKVETFEAREEQEVSLYEISLPHNSVLEAIQTSQNRSPENSAQLVKTTNSIIGNKEPVFDEELGAVGGVAETFEKELYQSNTASAQIGFERNDQVKHSPPKGEQREVYSEGTDVEYMINPKIPALELLLQSSDEQVRSFLTDISSNVPIDTPNEPLEVYRPSLQTAGNDELPNLSIFEEMFSWDKKTSNVPENFGSSEELESSELLAPGPDLDSPDHKQPAAGKSESEAVADPLLVPFTQKKPYDLKLDVQATQSRPLVHQTSQENLSKKSTTSTGSSSSSLFFSPDAVPPSATIEYQDRQIQEYRETLYPSPIPSGEQLEDDVDVPEEEKKKVNLAITRLRETLNDPNESHTLTLFNEQGEQILRFRIEVRDMKRPYKHHISDFKTKLFAMGIEHFELGNMEGSVINYDSRLKSSVMHLMVIDRTDANPKQCWCAGCQF